MYKASLITVLAISFALLACGHSTDRQGSTHDPSLKARNVVIATKEETISLEKRRGGGGGGGGRGGVSSGGSGGSGGGRAISPRPPSNRGTSPKEQSKAQGDIKKGNIANVQWGGSGGVGGREGAPAGKGYKGGPPPGHAKTEVTGRGPKGFFTGVAMSLIFWDLLFYTSGASMYLHAAHMILLEAYNGWELPDTAQHMPGFTNNQESDSIANLGPNIWPRYDLTPKPLASNGQDANAIWSMRTFRDGTCGDNGQDPLKTGRNTKDGPVMISEYISTDPHYHDNKACENFMVSTSKTPFIRSVAVWVDPLYAPGTDTQVLLNVYSHPLCATSLNSTATSLNAPDGTVPTQYDEKFPDYMNTYTGSGPIFKSAAYPDKEPGAWVCFQMQANAFHITFANITDNTFKNTGPNGSIAPADTVPDPKKPLPRDASKDIGGHPWLTNDIKKTLQVDVAV